MTDVADHTPPQSPPRVRAVAVSDIFAALGEGWRDFLRAPAFGLLFSLFYVFGGIVIFLQFSVLTKSWWMLPFALGFPMLGPFAAVGLYEVSRRLETGQPLDWAGVLGVVIQQRNRQVPSMIVFLVIVFLLWIYLAHLIFALFFGLKSLTNVMTSYDFLLSVDGIVMLAVGAAVGAALSFLIFAASVMGLPLLLDREIDFVSAMIASFRTVSENLFPMLVFGAITAALLFIGMAPFFLGLFVALPLLGHATWRLYRRAIAFDD